MYCYHKLVLASLCLSLASITNIDPIHAETAPVEFEGEVTSQCNVIKVKRGDLRLAAELNTFSSQLETDFSGSITPACTSAYTVTIDDVQLTSPPPSFPIANFTNGSWSVNVFDQFDRPISFREKDTAQALKNTVSSTVVQTLFVDLNAEAQTDSVFTAGVYVFTVSLTIAPL